MFDLDGTLADTLRDIAGSANHALVAVGRPMRAVEEYRYLAGQGVDHLIAHALGLGPVLTPEEQALHAACKAIYLAHYDAHKYDHTGPFEGVPELLDGLVARGLKLAVISNKPDHATRAMMAEAFGRWKFDAVRGARAGVPLKPDPAAALGIARELGAPAGEWVYVGDTRVDMVMGKSAGMLTVGVLWGFRDEAELRESGADAIIGRPGELLEVLGAR